MKNIVSSELPSLLYIDAYYELNRLTRPSSLEGILVDFVEQEILRKQDDEAFTITNLGALLLAKDLSVFPNLRKRPLRILKFEGNGNFNILDDKTFNEGYAISLQRAEDYIKAVIPSKEIIDDTFRSVIYVYLKEPRRFISTNLHASALATLRIFFNNWKLYINPQTNSHPANLSAITTAWFYL